MTAPDQRAARPNRTSAHRRGGGLPGTVARCTAEGWRISGSKIYSTGSHGRDLVHDPLVGTWLVHKDTPGITIIEDWDHLGMRATNSHEVRFDNSAPQAELDGSGMLWMAVLLSSVYDGIAHSARDWLVQWLDGSNLGAALSTLPRFQETVGHIDTLLFANQNLLHSAAQGHTPVEHAAQIKFLCAAGCIRRRTTQCLLVRA